MKGDAKAAIVTVEQAVLQAPAAEQPLAPGFYVRQSVRDGGRPVKNVLLPVSSLGLRIAVGDGVEYELRIIDGQLQVRLASGVRGSGQMVVLPEHSNTIVLDDHERLFSKGE